MVKQERAADAIAHDLERRIIARALPDNSPLPAEKELGVEYGASRTVIREAITALTNWGMLENRPRFRPTVRKPSYEAALDTMGKVPGRSGAKMLYQSRI